MNAHHIRSGFSSSAALAPAVSDRMSERQSAVTDRANAHFEKHREGWITKKYGELLRNDGQHPSLTPPGHVEDRSARLMRAAEHLVNRKQVTRLQKISAAGRNKEQELSR